MSQIVAEVTRGPLVESIHRGDLAVVDGSGKLVFSLGDPKAKVTYVRSSSKPIQAIPVVESGALEHYGITDYESTIFCASHSGENQHVTVVRSILKKIGLDETALQCGVHEPYYLPAADELVRAGQSPSTVHNNCSGKHSGMLTLCQYRGYDVSAYLDPSHPVQVAARGAMAEFAGLKPEEIVIGVDGCGVPVFGLSVYHMAAAYARLVNPEGLASKRAETAGRIVKNMMSNPQLVAGTGRLCTELMQATAGRIVAKSGAEGVYCLGVPERGIGLAFKVEDGNARAEGPVVIEVLKRMGVLSEAELEKLKAWHHPQITNHRKDVVGEIRAGF